MCRSLLSAVEQQAVAIVRLTVGQVAVVQVA
jgi:hypothetical protein